VSSLKSMHGGPHPGVPSVTQPSGSITSTPQSGPRSHQRSGQRASPTQKPISMRDVYQAQTTNEALR
jgi:hypothetical protein